MSPTVPARFWPRLLDPVGHRYFWNCNLPVEFGDSSCRLTKLVVRLFCELFLVAVLIWLGWTKSFHDRIDQIRGVEPAPAARQTQARQTTTAGNDDDDRAAPAVCSPLCARASCFHAERRLDVGPGASQSLDRPAYKTGILRRNKQRNNPAKTTGSTAAACAIPPTPLRRPRRRRRSERGSGRSEVRVSTSESHPLNTGLPDNRITPGR